MSLGIIKSNYEDFLSPFAQKSSESKGRKYKELPHPFRNPYQRDRDRVVHSRSFRRLEYKTQVLANHLGDHYRTRLTHSIEVSLISRCISRVINLHEDFTEALSLAHDLGHPPFGHNGEKILNELLSNEGGFDHNLQALRVVDFLENTYPQFPGLNLTYEVRKGLLKKGHKNIIKNFEEKNPDETLNPVLEAQIVDLADELAYTCHDLEDGLTHGFLNIKDVKKLSIWKYLDTSFNFKKNLPEDVMYYHIKRSLIDFLVKNMIETTNFNIKEKKIKTKNDIINSPKYTASFSPEVCDSFSEIRSFLFEKFYKHESILNMAKTAEEIITFLFNYYINFPKNLPTATYKRISLDSVNRVVCDYIAGMTDRFAIEDYNKKKK